MIRLLLIACLLTFSAVSYGQDSLRVMVYNLLMYGNNFGGCNTTNNNVNDKDGYLRKIIHYSKPDVFGINEMGSNVIYAERILANVLNIDTIDYYERASYSNLAGSNIVNMLFYDSRKLGIAKEYVVAANVRDINIYKLFYKDVDLATTNDTVFLTVVLAHLKAGSSSSDKMQRDQMVQSTMGTLKSNSIWGNVLFMGDFNIQSSSEAAYQRLVGESNPLYTFYDPINRQGSWNNSSGFADVHTQSTHTSGGCHSGGGMDDRYDQILSTTFALNDSVGMNYIPGSYTALGQDGNRFNSSLISPTNNSAPDSVIQALYDMSDHLPVYIDLSVDGRWISGLKKDLSSNCDLAIENGLIKNPNLNPFVVELLDIRGKAIFKENFNGQSVSLGQLVQGQENGVYISRIYNESSGCVITSKILKR